MFDSEQTDLARVSHHTYADLRWRLRLAPLPPSAALPTQWLQ